MVSRMPTDIKNPADHWLPRYRRLAVIAYAATLLLLAAAGLSPVIGLFDQISTRNTASARLVQLQARAQQLAEPSGPDAVWPPGSPFLEGSSATVASAALVEHAVNAVTQFGGTVLSSEVMARGPKPKDGFLRVVVNCELEQPALERLLYQLEAGMPFLFIDRLGVQSVTPEHAEGSRLRVMLEISGLWTGRE
jgi:general secretion pathway protein M